MQLREFFNYTQDGFEQDKTYDPEQELNDYNEPCPQPQVAYIYT